MDLTSSFGNYLKNGPTLNLKLGAIHFQPTYVQAGVIIFLIFLLVLAMAWVRRYFVDSSIKSALTGIFIGIFFTLIFEGFLLLSGKTVLVGLFGWDSAPKPISTLLDKGRNNLIQVLGVSDVRIEGDEYTLDKKLEIIYNSLSEKEKKDIERLICK